MRSVNRKTAGVLAAGAAAVAIAIGASVAAQADTPTPSPSSSATSSALGNSATAPGKQANPGKDNDGNGRGWGSGGRHGMGGFGGMGRFGLGGDVAALAQKLGVDETKLRQALGTVRDELKAERKGDKGSGMTPPKMGALSDDFANKLATQLGISADKVKTAILDLRAAAEASRQQAFASRLDQAVKDGKLTQAEADAVKKAAKLGLIRPGGKG